MARDHARIHARVWTDPEFTSLPRDPQWLYFAILSQPTLSFAGVTTFTMKRLARLAADTDPQTIQAALDVLQARRLVLVDDDTDELWVRSFVKNDGVLKSPNLLKRMVADVAAVMSPRIRAAFAHEWHTRLADQVADAHRDAVGPVLQALPEPPAVDPWATLPPPPPHDAGNPSPNPSSNGSLTRAAPAPAPTPAPSPTTEPGAADATPTTTSTIALAETANGFPTRAAPTIAAAITGWATANAMQLPPPRQRSDVHLALLDIAAEQLGPQHPSWRRIAQQLCTEYVAEATGDQLQPTAAGHVHRLVGEFGAHAALRGLAAAVGAGAGLDEQHAADVRALTKYAHAVCRGEARTA